MSAVRNISLARGFVLGVGLIFALISTVQADIKIGTYSWEHGGGSKPNAYGGGYNHLDLAWTWTVESGWQRIQGDWTTAANCLDDNPTWYAGHSGMQYGNYAVKTKYPSLWTRIKAHSDAGRYDGSEMNWSEGYFDFGGDEYNIRNYYISTRFCKDNFGYLPLNACGYDLDAPLWTQPKMMSYMIGRTTENPTGIGFVNRHTWAYDGMMRPNNWDKWRWTSDDNSMVVVGTGGRWAGDGGGAEICVNSAGRFPDFASKVFQQGNINTLVPNQWNDNMISAGSGYSLFFWGAKMCENRLLEAEKFAAFARPFGYTYPLNGDAYLYGVWGNMLLFNQHDIADAQGTPWQTGVSNTTNINIQDAYTAALKVADTTLTRALSVISSNVNTAGEGKSVIVYNALSWARTDQVFVKTADIGFSSPISVKDGAGTVIPSQVIVEHRITRPTVSLNERHPDGAGFTAQYFSDVNLITLAGTKTDSIIDFDWGGNKPALVPYNDNYSVRWTGQITPTKTTSYTFTSESDDGVRVWVNNILIIDHWVTQGPTKYSATVNLIQGQNCPVKVEYFQGSGGAVMRFSWTKADADSQPILSDSAYSLLVFTAENVPSLGFKEYKVFNSAATATAGVSASTQAGVITLDNQYRTVKIDKTTGAIMSLFDKTNAKELLSGPGNRIASTSSNPNWWTDCCQFYSHFPNSMPATLIYKTPTAVTLVDSGPAIARVKVTYVENGVNWDHYITLSSKIPVVANRMVSSNFNNDNELVVNIPLATSVSNGAKEWNTGVAYGHHKYVNKDKYTPTHKWANVASDAKDYSVALLENNCTIWSFYGVGGTHDLRMVLLAEKTSRWGGHWSKFDWEMSWGIWGHTGDWTDGAVQKGYEFNSPLIARVEQPHGGTLPAEFSFLSVEPENVVVTAVKKWEDEPATGVSTNTMQMRFYEIDGKNTDAVFRFPESPAVSAWESQGNEYGVFGNQLSTTTENGLQKVVFTMSHNQIRSLKVQTPYSATPVWREGRSVNVLPMPAGSGIVRLCNTKGQIIWQGKDVSMLRRLPRISASDGIYVLQAMGKDGRPLNSQKICRSNAH